MTLANLRPALATALLSMTLALPAGAQDAAPAPTPAPAPDAAAPAAPAEAPAGDAAPAEAPVAEAPASPAAPGGELSVGQALGGGPEIYVRETHGDWQIRCLRAPEGQEDPCQLYQRLADQQGNPTADVNIFTLPDDGELAAGATILTPLQTLLTAQVRMSVDGGQPRAYPFSFCDANGCYSRMGFTEEDVAALKRGSSATIVVVPALAPDQQAELRMSLTGFTAALDAVEPAASAAPAE